MTLNSMKRIQLVQEVSKDYINKWELISTILQCNTKTMNKNKSQLNSKNSNKKNVNQNNNHKLQLQKNCQRDEITNQWEIYWEWRLHAERKIWEKSGETKTVQFVKQIPAWFRCFKSLRVEWGWIDLQKEVCFMSARNILSWKQQHDFQFDSSFVVLFVVESRDLNCQQWPKFFLFFCWFQRCAFVWLLVDFLATTADHVSKEMQIAQNSLQLHNLKTIWETRMFQVIFLC